MASPMVVYDQRGHGSHLVIGHRCPCSPWRPWRWSQLRNHCGPCLQGSVLRGSRRTTVRDVCCSPRTGRVDYISKIAKAIEEFGYTMGIARAHLQRACASGERRPIDGQYMDHRGCCRMQGRAHHEGTSCRGSGAAQSVSLALGDSLHFPEAHRHRVEQWVFGSIGRKPTVLRTLNLPDPGQVMRDLEIMANPGRTKPNSGLWGKDRWGTFKTSGAKEYPPALASGMAMAIIQGIRRRWTQFGASFSAELTQHETACLAEVAAVSEKITRSHWLADYQG